MSSVFFRAFFRGGWRGRGFEGCGVGRTHVGTDARILSYACVHARTHADAHASSICICTRIHASARTRMQVRYVRVFLRA